MRRTILSLLLLTGLLGCDAELASVRSVKSPAQNQKLSEDRVSHEEFAIYDLVINSRYDGSARLLAIQEETASRNPKDDC